MATADTSQHASQKPNQTSFERCYTTPSGLIVHREETILADCETGARSIEALIDGLDERRGAIFASSSEVPGRYARWDRGFIDPPLVVEARDRRVELRALNARGEILLPALARAAEQAPGARTLSHRADRVALEIDAPTGRFSEEERSRRPGSFGLLRSLVAALANDHDPDLGLYGAFGYDLAFQFEPLALRQPRDPEQRDLVLYLPDELYVVDHRRERSHHVRYEFTLEGASTRGIARSGERLPYGPGSLGRGSDHEPGEYAQVVRRARQSFERGDLFEVVPSQVFSEGCPDPPSRVFRRLRERNPAPYGFVLNLGRREYLVGASPEMFVRVGEPGEREPRSRAARRRVETCPISGTIARGRDALEDSDQILALLASEKDACELTMCTDVDRNDKSRVCEPGTVKVIGRRQIELYSRLIHTVDHVEGTLREELDALDAFLSHAWAVTVTGAPKARAMRFIEEHELSPRRWYGGAVGQIGFDGRLDSGLVLRTIRIAQGIAEVRAGATLLHDSDPEMEEAETRLKASALLDAIRRPTGEPGPRASGPAGASAGSGRRVLVIDCQDSFVHTLGDYFRRTGAAVKTLRAGLPAADLGRYEPDLVVLSPGPGRPGEFGLAAILEEARQLALPVFGVCLGLQAIAEFFGGELGVLPQPVHGKASRVRVLGGRLLGGLPNEFRAGRYHSLHAIRGSLPPELRVTAEDDAGLVMALEHRSLPWSAVQFHPESILSCHESIGLRLVESCVSELPVRTRTRRSRAWDRGIVPG